MSRVIGGSFIGGLVLLLTGMGLASSTVGVVLVVAGVLLMGGAGLVVWVRARMVHGVGWYRTPGAARREAAAERAGEKQNRADHHRRDAAPPVGDATGQVCADRAAEQGARDREPGERRRQVELALHGVDRAVHHRGVEAEQESADRARHREGDHLQIGLGSC